MIFRVLASALGIFLLATGIARSEERRRPVDTAECKEITARLVEATGATVGQYSQQGNIVGLKYPDMDLFCGSGLVPGFNRSETHIVLNFDGAFPPASWFAHAAKAGGAVTGETFKALDQGIHQCHRKALKSEEFTHIDTPHAAIECSVSTGVPAGLYMSIWFNDEATLRDAK